MTETENSTINHRVKQFYSSIDGDRFVFYGLSILLVVLCHASQFTPHISFIEIFKCGYIGVDIFLFFSAYGCCHSFTQKPFRQYIAKRAIRIIPLYVIFAVCISLFYTISGTHFTLWDWICNLSMLQYWGIGGKHIEWFLCALAIVYVFLPVFFKLVKICGLYGFIIITIGIAVILTKTCLPWYYLALLGRIPMIYLGCYVYSIKGMKVTWGGYCFLPYFAFQY